MPGIARRPAPDTLKDWGLSHRFAGSGDRAAIAGLVYDALRRRASSAWLMGDEAPRAVVLGMLKQERGLDFEAVMRLFDGSKYSSAQLSDAERAKNDVLQVQLGDALRLLRRDLAGRQSPHARRLDAEAQVVEGAAEIAYAPFLE